MNTFLKRFICCFIPVATLRHRILRNDRSVIRIIENGKERRPRWNECHRIFVSQDKHSHGNILKIHMPNNKVRLNVKFHNNNNIVEIAPSVQGVFEIMFHDDNGWAKIGSGCSAGYCFMNITGSGVELGQNCTLAMDVLFYSGDGHTIFDNKNKKVLNANPEPIIIGDHCWLGRNSTFTKSASIPDNTIVGIGSVVTKKFKQKHTAIAGIPAKVVHENIGWDAKTPQNYLKGRK